MRSKPCPIRNFHSLMLAGSDIPCEKTSQGLAIMTAVELDGLSAAAARFAAAPAFPEAVRRYSEGQAEFRQGSKLVNKLLSQDASWRVIGYLLYLHADREQFGRGGGATYSRLLDLCTRRNEVGRRTLKTMLALMRFAGFVQAGPSAFDRRVKIYQPTERMMGFVRRWLSYPAIALDILEPQVERARRLRDDPSFIERFLVSGGRHFTSTTPLTERMPEFRFFFDGPEGAVPVLLSLLLAEMQGTPIPSRAKIAKRFGLSKTQVTRVLVAGAQQGFFTLDDAGIPAPTLAAREGYNRCVALELAFYAEHMQPPAPTCPVIAAFAAKKPPSGPKGA